MKAMDFLMADLLAKQNVQKWMMKFAMEMQGGANANPTPAGNVYQPAEQQLAPDTSGNPAE